MTARTCQRCAHGEPRYRLTGAYTWCRRFHCVPEGVCIDWAARPSEAVKAILTYRKAVA